MTAVNCPLILTISAGLLAKGGHLARSPTPYLNQVFFPVKRLDHMASGNHKGTSSGGKSKPLKPDQRWFYALKANVGQTRISVWEARAGVSLSCRNAITICWINQLQDYHSSSTAQTSSRRCFGYRLTSGQRVGGLDGSVHIPGTLTHFSFAIDLVLTNVDPRKKVGSRFDHGRGAHKGKSMVGQYSGRNH